MEAGGGEGGNAGVGGGLVACSGRVGGWICTHLRVRLVVGLREASVAGKIVTKQRKKRDVAEARSTCMTSTQ